MFYIGCLNIVSGHNIKNIVVGIPLHLTRQLEEGPITVFVVSLGVVAQH